MLDKKNSLLVLGQRLFLLLVLYSLCRLLFFTFNSNYFSDVSAASLAKDFFFGLRFDVAAIVISNILFITLHFNPFPVFYTRYYQLGLKIVYLFFNLTFLLFTCIDFGLFRFSAKHATSDAFRIMSFGEDFINTLPVMILDFWYLLVVFAALSMLLIFGYGKIKITHAQNHVESKKKFMVLRKIGVYVVCVTLVIIAFRGGVQFKPVSIISASKYGSAKDMALILNTPFTILKTFNKNSLREMNFFSATEAGKISPVHHHYRHAEPFRNLNVVLIILESFGKEYIGSLNSWKGYTPFLDSLIGESLVFDQAYANGKRSIEGIPSIVAGIPPLMPEPFITSAYSGNTINSIASLLKKKGYYTSFYHGGTNGTMNFDNFIRLAGYETYYGRREYNNDKDFDGHWGIYDEPFLHHYAQELSNMREPFFSTVFTLSSHHPYAVPIKYQNHFSKGTLPVHESIQYTDLSLKYFFETVSSKPWFANTLFVLVADHTALSEYPFYQNKVGMYSVPIIYYHKNSGLKGRSPLTTQQIDILPSILDYLHFDQPFFSFGESVFDSVADHFAVNFLNDTYQILSNGYSFSMNTLKSHFLFHYATDSLLQRNVATIDTATGFKMELKLKAIIQNYNSALIKNKMQVEIE